MVHPLFTDRKLLALSLVGLLAGAGSVFAFSGDGGLLSTNASSAPSIDDGGCSGGGISGEKLDARRTQSSVRSRGDHAERSITYKLSDVPDGPGRLVACTGVGDIEIEPGRVGEATVHFLIQARGPEARHVVEDAEVLAQFRERGGGLQLLAQDLTEHRHDETDWSVDITIILPSATPYDLAIASGVGDIEVDSLKLGHVRLHTGVGDIDVEAIEDRGNIEAVTGVGDIDLSLVAKATFDLVASTGTGDVDIGFARSTSAGYDVLAHTGVGDVDLEIGATEKHDRDRNSGVGDREHARSRGFSSKANQVTAVIETGVGSIDVTA